MTDLANIPPHIARQLLEQIDDIERNERALFDGERVRKSLRLFVKDAFTQLQTGTELQWGWYLDAVCDFCDAILRGDILRGVINLRNRSLKSIICSVCMHPYDWLTNPWRRHFTGGYDHKLALEHSWASRVLINTEWYQTLIQNDPWELVGDQNEKGFYANTRGGRRIANQVGGGTGKGGHVFVIDDPLSIDESWSDAANEKANRWFFQTVMSRLDDPKTARVLLMQHRLRPDDTSGTAIKEEHGFEVLSLPLEYDPKRRCFVEAIDFEDPRIEEGELLCPERWGPAEVESDKKFFNILYDALCNQNPKNRGSKLVEDRWFRIWPADCADSRLPETFDIVQSWDFSTKGLDPTSPMKKGRKRSKVGGIVAGMTPSACYIFDVFIDHCDYMQQKPAIRGMHNRWKDTVRTYVEDESNGSAIILEMTEGEYETIEGEAVKHPGIPGIRGVNPTKKGGKYQRMAAISHFIKSGNVYVPHPDLYPWVKTFLHDVCEFPNAEDDELPDCLSQLLSEEWLPDGLPAKDQMSAEEYAHKMEQAYGTSTVNPGVHIEYVTRGEPSG